MPIKLDFQADPADYERGVDKVIAANQRITKSSDTVSKDAVRANDKIGDSATDAAKDVDRAAGKMTDSIHDWSRDGQRDSEKLGESISEDVERGSKDAESSLGDFSSNASDLGQAAADAFSGEWDGVGQSVGQAVGDGLSVLGPLGVLAGLGAAAGISALFDTVQQGTEESKQRVSDMYDDMIESGNRFVSENYISEAIQAIQTNAEGAVTSYSKAQESAQLTGASLSTTLRALAGDTEAQTRVEDDRVRALQAAQTEQENYIEANGRESAAIGDKIGSLELLQNQFSRTNGEQQTAVDKSQVYLEAMGKNKSAADNTADAIGRIADQQSRVKSEQTITITADTSQAESQLSLFLNKNYNVGVGVLLRPGQEIPG